MQIDIITLHCPLNCGSVLQGFALRKYLAKQYGENNVQLIDYVPHYMEDEGRPVRTFLRKILFYKQYRQRSENFGDFIKRHCVLTNQKYKSYEELKSNPPKADIYVTGSDQLWNPCFNCGNDPAYYLQFIQNVPKMSYAASMGTDNYTEEQLKNIADKIYDYSFVSVREQCSVAQLEQAGVPDVKCVCDPTLLLNAEDYSAIAKSHAHLGKYVAVYLVERSELLDQTLEMFRQQGYKIVGVAGYLNKYECDVRLMDAGPAEFLGLIRDASFVVATSFHATVFSLIFHKQFAIIPPSMNPARIEQLLSMVKLTDRIITKPEQLSGLQRNIDYQEVQNILDRHIEESRVWLKNALDTLEEKTRHERV